MKNQNKKVFKNAQVTLEGNLFRCGNKSIQISNISQQWAGRLPKKRLPFNLILNFLLLSLIGYYFMNSTLIVSAALGGVFFLIFRYFLQVEYYGLNIELSSGELYSFVSGNKVFVNQVYELINEIILKSKNSFNYIIDFKDNGEIIDYLSVLKAEEKSEERSELEIKETAEEIIEEKSEEKKAEITMNQDNAAGIMEFNNIKEQLNTEINVLYNNYKNGKSVNGEVLLLIGQSAQQIRDDNTEGMKELYEKFIMSGLINNCNELGLNLLIEEIKKNIYV